MKYYTWYNKLKNEKLEEAPYFENYKEAMAWAEHFNGTGKWNHYSYGNYITYTGALSRKQFEDVSEKNYYSINEANLKPGTQIIVFEMKPYATKRTVDGGHDA